MPTTTPLSRPRPLAAAARFALASGLLITGAVRLGVRPDPASAAVSHVSGYAATVDGFSSWYGSYGMGGLGVAWCIDHGIRAPDPALSYVPTDVADQPAAARTALAWMFGRHGSGPDRVTSAALMLAAHDLMGAVYPSGRLDLGRLTVARMSGFGTSAAAVLERARSIRADALAHAGLRSPYALTLAIDPGPPLPPPDPAPIAPATADVATLADAAGTEAAPSESTEATASLDAPEAGSGGGHTASSGHDDALAGDDTAAGADDSWDAAVEEAAPAAGGASPMGAVAAVVAPPPGTEVGVVATLTDAAGTPIAGIGLAFSLTGTTAPTTSVTGTDGTARFRFVAPTGAYRVSVSGTAPDLALRAFRATAARAQRVAQGARVPLAASLDLESRPLDGRIRILKRGDAEPHLPVVGARFEIWPATGGGPPLYAGPTALVIGPDGTTGPAIVPPGRYEVREVAPPPGYEAAGPWVVDVAPDAIVTLEVEDPAIRGSLAVLKIDAETLAPVAGAVLRVTHDADRDGTYEQRIGRVTTTLEPIELGDLLPGRYRVVEVEAPPGYELDETPVDVEVVGGEVVPVAVQDRRTPPPTTVPPTTSTTAPPATVPPTTAAPTTTPPPAPRATPPPSLPRTGADPAGLASTGAGLALLGSSLVTRSTPDGRRRRTRRPR